MALFLILGLGYATLTPIFENSDETLHYPYVKHLADGQGLPLAIPNQLWNQEATQPPLYYALAAAVTFWINSDNLPEHLQSNPHWRFSDVRTFINDNQNVLIKQPPTVDSVYRKGLPAGEGAVRKSAVEVASCHTRIVILLGTLQTLLEDSGACTGLFFGCERCITLLADVDHLAEYVHDVVVAEHDQYPAARPRRALLQLHQ